MCPHEQILRRIMARLRFLITPPIHPPINCQLFSLRISIFKQKYNYTYEQLSEIWGVSLTPIQKWVKQTATPKKKHYNYIMNYLENHN